MISQLSHGTILSLYRVDDVYKRASWIKKYKQPQQLCHDCSDSSFKCQRVRRISLQRVDNLGVYLCRAYILMGKHLRYRIDAVAQRHEKGGMGMPEDVEAYVLRDSG